MRIQDQVVLALTIWRENRGGGIPGMQSVANVIVNRATRNKTSAFAECVKPWQFSSITAKGDPELTLWPKDDDVRWAQALDLAEQAASGALQDITGGALLYYAPHGIQATKRFTLPNGETIPFPDRWDETVVKYLCTVQDQVFFR